MIKPTSLSWLTVLMLSLWQIECLAQEPKHSQELVGYDYYRVKDSLSDKSAAESDAFYEKLIRTRTLTPCEVMSFTCDNGSLLLEKNDKVGALKKAQKAKEFGGTCTEPFASIKLNVLFGKIYEAEGQRDKALEHLLAARRISEKTEPSFINFDVNHTTAMLLYEERNHAGAIEFFEAAHDISRQRPQLFQPAYAKKALMESYNTLGLCYRRLNRYEAAIDNFFKSRSIAKEMNDEFWVGLTNGNVGTSYHKLGLRDSALYYLKIDAVLSRKHEEWESLINACFTLGSIYQGEGNHDVAKLYYDSVENLLESHPSRMYPLYYETLSNFSFARGEYKKALDYYRQFHRQSDSLVRIEASNNLARIQHDYEAEKMLSDMELMKKDFTIKTKEAEIQKSLLFGIIVIVVLLIAVLYMGLRRYREKKDQAKMLQKQVEDRTRELTESNAELDTFLYRASHDFRGPLSTLMGLHHLGKLTIKDPEALDLFSKVGDVVAVMDKMLNKVAAMSFISQKHQDTSAINLHDLAAEVINELSLPCNDHCILNLIGKDVNITTNRDLLRITFENLLENAVRSKDKDSQMQITLTSAITLPGVVHVVVSDTGKGIEEKYQEKIFSPFFRADDDQKGNGLGLYLVKKSLQKLKGDINVSSRPGKGSTFTLILPLAQAPPDLVIKRSKKKQETLIS
jgi:signal transduction histidine kinase